jgi:NAD(P)-dependent dehydrogenase (short-subunit alcohol dehydrogenase family)
MIGPSVERFHQASGMAIEAIYEMLRKAQPVQRLGTPQEIGKAVMFLLSDDCPFMTGRWSAPTADIPASKERSKAK